MYFNHSPPPISRSETIEKLKSNFFDIVIIGGGSTGVGIALEAASRNLKVALIESHDFAYGTSSRSTKLLHGGVRYLEQAFKNLDRKQFKQIKTSLKERSTVCQIAPYLTKKIPIIIPLYKWEQIPYYYLGLKVYDLISGSRSFGPTQFLSSEEILTIFPQLKSNSLKGGVLFYDGQFNDARMNISVALTAYEHGALLLNHAKIIDLLKNNEKTVGVKVQDQLSNEVFYIQSAVVVNATGPLSDSIRKIDYPKAPSIIEASSGTHLVIDNFFGYKNKNSKSLNNHDYGLLIPKTSDDRVLFVLPWNKKILVGTSDIPTEKQELPLPTKEETSFLLQSINDYFVEPITVNDIHSTWAGIRPLIKQSSSEKSTSEIPRELLIEASNSGVITIAGGKWTTFLKAAKDVVEYILSTTIIRSDLPSQLSSIKIIGTKGYHQNLAKDLANKHHISLEIANYLVSSYGDRSLIILQQYPLKFRSILVENFPYIQSEVLYAIDYEYSCSPVDLLTSRIPLAFIDQKAAFKALPIVVKIMEEKLNWDPEYSKNELNKGKEFLNTFQV